MIAIAPDRFDRALAYVNEYHAAELPYPLEREIALRILKRTNALIESEGRDVSLTRKHELLREAAGEERGMSETLRAFYRKLVNAYWRFPKVSAEAEP